MTPTSRAFERVLYLCFRSPAQALRVYGYIYRAKSGVQPQSLVACSSWQAVNGALIMQLVAAQIQACHLHGCLGKVM